MQQTKTLIVFVAALASHMQPSFEKNAAKSSMMLPPDDSATHNERSDVAPAHQPSDSGEEAVSPCTTVSQQAKVERLRQEFELLRYEWNHSSYRADILDKISVTIHSTKMMYHVVCVGIGSIEHHGYTYVNNTGLHCHTKRSWRQLLLLLDIVDMLERRTGHVTPVYIHDPALTSVDISFLAILKIYFVTESVARELIVSASFLFAPYLNWAVLLQKYLPGKDPALFIGNAMHYLTQQKLERIAGTLNTTRERLLDPGVHARAMLLVKDTFLRSRVVVNLDGPATFDGDDVAGIIGLFAFVKL